MGVRPWLYPPGEDPEDADGGFAMRERRRALLAEEGRDRWGSLCGPKDLAHYIWHASDPGFLLRETTARFAPDTDPDNRTREEQEKIGTLLKHAARRFGFEDWHMARANDMPEWRLIDIWLGQYTDARWAHIIAAQLGYRIEIEAKLVPIAEGRRTHDLAAYAERTPRSKLRRRRLRKTQPPVFVPRVVVRRRSASSPGSAPSGGSATRDGGGSAETDADTSMTHDDDGDAPCGTSPG